MAFDTAPDAIGRMLMPGEKLLWWDRPRQGLMLTNRDWLLIPFSLVWGGFVIFWEATALTSKAPLVMRLWGIPFVLAGLFLIVGRFFIDAWFRTRMFYALTDSRVLIVRTGFAGSLVSISLDRLPDLVLNERRDGSGTIRFGQPQSLLPGGSRNAGFGPVLPSLDPTPQFYVVADARRVFDRLQARLHGPGR